MERLSAKLKKVPPECRCACGDAQERSITYRIAVEGRKVFTLQTPPDYGSDNPFADTLGKAGGFR